MQSHMGYHRYTGTAPLMPFGPWRGFGQSGYCGKCGQPSASCCCGCRECRKEAKELLVTPGTQQQPGEKQLGTAVDPATMFKILNVQALQELDVNVSAGVGTSFIGGGCCVTLAVEYAPTVSTAVFALVVAARDSEGTALLWGRSEPAGTGYRVHECIITTKPGATLLVAALNCTARVRWCEVFSCC
jgi:hypothetical protein